MENLDFPVSEILAQLDLLNYYDNINNRDKVRKIQSMIREQKGNVVTVPPDYCLFRSMYGSVYLMGCGSMKLGPQEVISKKPCHLVIDRGSCARVLVTPEECQRIEKIIKVWEKSHTQET